MKRLILAAAGVASFALATQSTAQTTTIDGPVGACVWGKLSEPVRADFLANYPQAVDVRAHNRAMARLSRYRAALNVAAIACADSGPPIAWLVRAVATHATRLGTAARLEERTGVTRVQLDATWRGASDTARGCLRSVIGERYKLKMPPCADAKSVAALIEPLKLADQVDRNRAIVYLVAAAESQLAETLIARRESLG